MVTSLLHPGRGDRGKDLPARPNHLFYLAGYKARRAGELVLPPTPLAVSGGTPLDCPRLSRVWVHDFLFFSRFILLLNKERMRRTSHFGQVTSVRPYEVSAWGRSAASG